MSGAPASQHEHVSRTMMPWWLRLWTSGITLISGLFLVGLASYRVVANESEPRTVSASSNTRILAAQRDGGVQPQQYDGGIPMHDGGPSIERPLREEEQPGFPLEAFLHLAIPGAVLIVELYMLGRMKLEARERQHESIERGKTMDELANFRVAIGRSNYLGQIEAAIQHAEREIVFTSATMESSFDSPDQQRIVRAVTEREKQDEHNKKPEQDRYRHRGIVARTQSALIGALELSHKTRVQVRMSSALSTTRLRFVVRDQEQSILGIATGARMQKDGPTTMSFSVESGMLAESLQSTFEKIWVHADSPWKYLDEFIDEMKRSKPHFTRSEVRKIIEADRLKIEDKALEEKSASYKSLPALRSSAGSA